MECCAFAAVIIMNEDNLSVERRRRVNRIKRYILVLVIILLITPTVISIYAMNRLSVINNTVDELQKKLDEVELTYLLKETAKDSLEDIQVQEPEEVLEEEPEIESEKDLPDDYRSVYLTFDDGPSVYTSQILDILDSYGVKATFFVTGAQKDAHPEWYKEIVERGHTIGMHSYTHVYSSVYADEDAFVDDIEQIHQYILDTTGINSSFYRFPGGSSNRVSSLSMDELCKLVHSRGYEYYDWNVSSQDASNPTPSSQTIVNNVLTGIGKHQQSIVLMHDSGDKYATVQALPSIIEGIQKKEKTVILPISMNTKPVWHVSADESED